MVRTGQTLVLLLFPFFLSAQIPGVWTSAGLKATSGGPWSWSAQLESRWEGPHDTGFLDLAVSREWGRHFEANFQWRTSMNHGDIGYSPEYRAALRLIAKGDLGRGSWDARFMAQEARAWILVPDWAAAPLGRSALRGRVGYTSPWMGRWRWGLSTESIWRDHTFDAQRNRLDLDLDLNSADRLTLGYQLELGPADPDHVLRIGWTHDLGTWQPLRDRRRAAVPPARSFDATGSPVITEGRSAGLPVCAADQIFLSEAGTATKPADFIELHNPTDRDCRLTGWRFDDEEQLEDWVGTTEVVPALGCWVAYSDGPGGFDSGLSAEGERIYLADPEGNVRVYTLSAGTKKLAETFDFSGVSRAAPPSPGRHLPHGE